MSLDNMNPELNIKKIEITNHAYERSVERFNMRDKNAALGYFRSQLKYAKRIGEVVAEDGNTAILYAYGRIAIYLSLDLTTIITVNKYNDITYNPLKEKVAKLHETEYRKLSRSISAKSKKLKLNKLEAEVEISQLKLQAHKSRSVATKNTCKARIKAIQQVIDEMEKELDNLQSTRRQIAKSMVAVI